MIIPLLSQSIFAPKIMARQERLIPFALPFERLQFRSHIDLSVAVITNIKRYHTNWVASNQERILFLIIKHKSEDARNIFQEVDALVAIKCQNHFAIASCLKVILSGIATADFLMIIDFAIHSQNLLAVRREERLSTTFGVNYRKTFVSKNGRTATIDSAPIRTTMANLMTHLQSLLSQFRSLLLYL